MVKLPHTARSGCPINFGLEIFGDKWTFLILRDLLIQGKKTFGEFQASEEGIASNVLSERLARLEHSGLVKKQRDANDARQFHYHATKAGSALIPALMELSYWGAVHDPKTAAPPNFVKAYESDREALLAALTSGVDVTKG